MNQMSKIIGITIDVVFAAIGLSSLISLGNDYRHILAAISGSLLVTTNMKSKTLGEKVWYALGGFSVSCYVTPYVCERFGCDTHASLCVAIYFGMGALGMSVMYILLSILDETKANIPKLIVDFFKFLTIRIKTFLGVNETTSSKPQGGNDSADSSGSATDSNDKS